jgi:hypothetical protein
MPIDEAQTAMARIIWEVADVLEGGAAELRSLARRVKPALTATPLVKRGRGQ